MSTQPEALRLADRLDQWGDQGDLLEAAAELRRLQAENEALQYELKAEQALSFRRQLAELEAENEVLRADAGLMRGGIGG